MARVIAVTNFKGGVAKTTTTSNLAAVAALRGLKVLVIDFDSQGQAGVHYGIAPSANRDKSVFKAMLRNGDAKRSVFNVMKWRKANGLKRNPEALARIDLLPSYYDLMRTQDLAGGAPARLRRIVEELRGGYDLVLIESAPSNIALHAAVLGAADELLIPFIPDGVSVAGTVGFVDEIYGGMVRSRETNAKITGLLPVIVRSSTNLHRDAIEEMRAYAKSRGTRLLESMTPSSITNPTSVAMHGLPVVLTKPGSAQGRSYEMLADEIGLSMVKSKCVYIDTLKKPLAKAPASSKPGTRLRLPDHKKTPDQAKDKERTGGGKKGQGPVRVGNAGHRKGGNRGEKSEKGNDRPAKAGAKKAVAGTGEKRAKAK